MDSDSDSPPRQPEQRTTSQPPPSWLNPTPGPASTGKTSATASASWRSWLEPQPSSSSIPHTPAHRSQGQAFALAKVIARAAEAAAIAAKRAGDAMAEAVAASKGDSQPTPPPVVPPGKRGRKRPANVPAPTKRTLIRRASASHDAALPLQGGDDETGDDGLSSQQDETDNESLEGGEKEGDGDRAPIRRAAVFLRPAAFGVLRNPLPAASATAGTGAAVPLSAGVLASAETKAAVPAPAPASAGPLAGPPAKAGASAAVGELSQAEAGKANPAKAKAARGTAKTFAARYPPKEPIRRGRFLAERQSWHDWKNGLDVYSAEDSQANFYSYLRKKVDLGAENYGAVIDNIIQEWQMNSQSHCLTA